jgi:hypothetical protein
MKITAHFYDRATGLFVGSYSGDELEANTPAGRGVFISDERFDRAARRFDVASGTHVAYEPPPPSLDVLRSQAQAGPLAVIAELEAGQHRPLREIALALAGGLEPPAEARQTLERIDADIVQERQALSAIAAAQSEAELKAAAKVSKGPPP